jgi:hypothetical protein
MEEDGLYTDEVCGVYDSEAVPTHAEAGAGHPSSLMIWDWKIQKKKKKKKKLKLKLKITGWLSNIKSIAFLGFWAKRVMCCARDSVLST